MRKIFVRPRKGLRVRKFHDPKYHLKESGELVPATAEWLRAVKNGDCLVGAAPVSTKKAVSK